MFILLSPALSVLFPLYAGSWRNILLSDSLSLSYVVFIYSPDKLVLPCNLFLAYYILLHFWIYPAARMQALAYLS